MTNGIAVASAITSMIIASTRKGRMRLYFEDDWLPDGDLRSEELAVRTWYVVALSCSSPFAGSCTVSSAGFEDISPGVVSIPCVDLGWYFPGPAPIRGVTGETGSIWSPASLKFSSNPSQELTVLLLLGFVDAIPARVLVKYQREKIVRFKADALLSKNYS